MVPYCLIGGNQYFGTIYVRSFGLCHRIFVGVSECFGKNILALLEVWHRIMWQVVTRVDEKHDVSIFRTEDRGNILVLRFFPPVSNV
jgi:hypothetical protein